MATTNLAKRQITCKIVYWGPESAGKSTALQAICDKLEGDNEISTIFDGTNVLESLDYLPAGFGSFKGCSIRLQLFALSGPNLSQDSKIKLLKDADGIVFVADSQASSSNLNQKEFELLGRGLAENGLDPERIACVMQYNKRDLPDIKGIADLQALLNSRNVPAFETIATAGINVREALKNLTSQILTEVRKA